MTNRNRSNDRWSYLNISKWIIVVAVMLAALPLYFLQNAAQARSMSFDYNFASYIPGAMRVEANGKVIDRISSGRNSSGGTYYKGKFSDRMEFRILWYDAAEKKAWISDISVSGRELSAYDPEHQILSLGIIVGPGADVLVTTPNPEGLRLIHEGRLDETTPEMRPAVVLQELCATPISLSDPRIAPIVSAAHDPDDSLSSRIERIASARSEYIEGGGVIKQRCTVSE